MSRVWMILRHCASILVYPQIICLVFPNIIHSLNVKIKDSRLGVHIYLWADVGISPYDLK